MLHLDDMYVSDFILSCKVHGHGHKSTKSQVNGHMSVQ